MSNDNDVTIGLPGGVTRVTHGEVSHDTTEADAHAREMLRSGVSDGSTLRLNADGTATMHGGTTRHMVGSDRDLTSDNILDTVRKQGASMRPTAIEGKHVVTVNGLTTTVDNAVRCGYLEQVGPGQYRETGLHRTERQARGAQYEENYADPKTQPARSNPFQAPMPGSNLVIR